MAKWKLCRQTYGDNIYEFTEGDQVTIGRGTQNTIILPSLSISRKHCVITVKKDEVIIEDLKSANGIFVGLKKIPPNIPFSLSNNDIIGLGWTDGAPLAKVKDDDKFVFKLLKMTNDSSIIDRIQFQNEEEPRVIPAEIMNHSNVTLPQISKPISSLSLKRKSNTGKLSQDECNGADIKNSFLNSIENSNNLPIKKFKCNFSYEDAKEQSIIKIENEDEQYEVFNIKQECFDDEVQIIDSDSDSEQWYIRLSQNSPRKSFSTFNETRKSEDFHQDSSYSQLDDDVLFIKHEIERKNESDEEAYEDDLFTILTQPPNVFDGTSNKCIETDEQNNVTHELRNVYNNLSKENEQITPLVSVLNPPVDIFDGTYSNKNVPTNHDISSNENNIVSKLTNTSSNSIEKNKKDNQVILLSTSSISMSDHISNNKTKETIEQVSNLTNFSNKREKERKHIIVCEAEIKISDRSKKIQLTNAKSSPIKKSTSKSKIKNKNGYNRSKSSSSKIQITNSQKEERKKKLRDIAVKDKGEVEHSYNHNLQKNEDCVTITSKVTISQKEERKKKLLDIAVKDKGEVEHSYNHNLQKNEDFVTTTSKVSTKVSTSNRGAFLINSKQLTTKPRKKGKVVQNDKNTTKDTNSLTHHNECKEQPLENVETKDHTKKKNRELKAEHSKHRTLSTDTQSPAAASDITMPRRYSNNVTKDNSKANFTSIQHEETEQLKLNTQSKMPNSKIFKLTQKKNTSLDKSSINAKKNVVHDNTLHSNQVLTSGDIKMQHKIPIPETKTEPELKSMKTILKPMKENKEPNRKSGKRVTFSEIPPEVKEFEIEPGNQMRKTSSVKSILLATQQNMPVFSLQKIALMRILRWNPQWLEEQNHFIEPPPILGHNNVPMAILHFFNSHTQYVELIGDLLLMEIWECLTQGHVKTRNENRYLQMRIESLPLVPPQSHGLELINLNVNVSVPTVQAHTIPREGEIITLNFGEDAKICRFFFVHNVRCLPSPPNNINSFYSISLQTSFTEKMRTLQRGGVMYGRSLAYINKDLRLFEAMEYLSKSPLNEVILNPQPRHFLLDDADRRCNMESQWSQSLNDSQRRAVTCAVSAAHGERPRIHMIQGPPGTGKSRVICAIVMEYFYDAAGRKQRHRGKMLLCATSNAAVDELVIRLLDIRQSLPQPERLKVVRVGRVEAMHPRARDISSLKLAQRDVARLQPDASMQPSGTSGEISLLEAKKNMWQTKAVSTDDDARKAYCLSRVADINKKINVFRSGAGASSGGCAPEQLAQAERRVLEGADVVLTTLASAHSHKMRGLAGRIALCVVDEAGQAIEPETLVPLTLGVTRLALVGDPQQLPGFICSQRAKQHGLGESLLSRLSSCAESWAEGGPILLDQQYRMHPHIADYPNRAFYDGRVRNETALSQLPALDATPYFVLGIISGDNGQDASGANDAEAWGAARVALALRSRLRAAASAAAPPSAHSLAVITPYAAQRDLVRCHVRTLLQADGSGGGGGEEGEVEVNTVDSFQGQERSVVVVSLARSHGLGFLAAAGRMNVMLTRAKHALVLCLNPKALEKNNQWRSLVEDAQKRNLYGTLPIHMCRPPSVQQVSNEEILQYLSSNPPCNNNTREAPHHSFRRGPNKRNRNRHDRGRN